MRVAVRAAGGKPPLVPKIEKQKLGDFRFPEVEETIRPEEMRRIIQAAFTPDWDYDIEVMNRATEQYVDSAEVAGEVVNAILRRPDVKRTNRVVEQIADEAQEELDDYIQTTVIGVQGLTYVPYTTFLEFVHGDPAREGIDMETTLKTILDKHATSAAA